MHVASRQVQLSQRATRPATDGQRSLCAAEPNLPPAHPPADRSTVVRPDHSGSRGLTLVEMLVAMAVTLVMMAAVVNLFANLGGSVRNRRALIELDGRLRQVRAQLARDLAGATCPATTWHDPGANEGYIEIVEGEYSDWHPSILLDGKEDLPRNPELDYAASPVPGSQLMLVPGRGIEPTPQMATDGLALGDWDDILALTVRNEAEPFVADWRNPVTGERITVESSLAEVVWIATETITREDGALDEDRGFRTIYRRVWLIAPWLPAKYNLPAGNFGERPDNISVRVRPDGAWVGNTLGDLTRRENRIYHRINEFPHRLERRLFDNIPPEQKTSSVMLTDALAFDVRVYDPGAPVFTPTNLEGVALRPCDRGWAASASDTPAALGAYVDLGWYWDPRTNSARTENWNPEDVLPLPLFHAPLQMRIVSGGSSATMLPGYPAVYDTWSWHYENDGIDQDGDQLIDEGANGLDDLVNNQYANGVDDPAERETAPPYDVPLRGIKVKLRVYERDTRQVRETSVTHSFID